MEFFKKKKRVFLDTQNACVVSMIKDRTLERDYKICETVINEVPRDLLKQRVLNVPPGFKNQKFLKDISRIQFIYDDNIIINYFFEIINDKFVCIRDNIYKIQYYVENKSNDDMFKIEAVYYLNEQLSITLYDNQQNIKHAVQISIENGEVKIVLREGEFPEKKLLIGSDIKKVPDEDLIVMTYNINNLINEKIF